MVRQGEGVHSPAAENAGSDQERVFEENQRWSQRRGPARFESGRSCSRGCARRAQSQSNPDLACRCDLSVPLRHGFLTRHSLDRATRLDLNAGLGLNGDRSLMHRRAARFDAHAGPKPAHKNVHAPRQDGRQQHRQQRRHEYAGDGPSFRHRLEVCGARSMAVNCDQEGHTSHVARPKAERVSDDRHGAEGHRRGGDDRREQ